MSEKQAFFKIRYVKNGNNIEKRKLVDNLIKI